jgi:hypothetical protein
MRVNIDSAAVTDPRMHLLGRHLGCNVHEVLGRLFRVWLVCYDRRSPVLSEIEIDIAGDRDGFATAMVASGLAENDETGVYVKGVTERIEFLEKQSDKGRKSGEVRKARAALQTPAQHGFNFSSNQNRTAVQPRFRPGSATPRTYSPDLDQDQAPDQDQDHVPDVPSKAEVGQQSDSQNAPGRTTAETAPPVLPAVLDPAERKPERELPDAAYTLAHLLLQAIERNHPTGRLAKSAERVKEATARRWAETIDRMSRIDRLSWAEIEAMIHWSQRHTFWQSVILGADNLRDKWDKMAAQRNQRSAAARNQHSGPSQFDVLDEHSAELERRAKEQKKE